MSARPHVDEPTCARASPEEFLLRAGRRPPVFWKVAQSDSFAPSGAGRRSVRGGAVSPEATTHGGAGTPAGWMQQYLDAWNARDVEGADGFRSEDGALADLTNGGEG